MFWGDREMEQVGRKVDEGGWREDGRRLSSYRNDCGAVL